MKKLTKRNRIILLLLSLCLLLSLLPTVFALTKVFDPLRALTTTVLYPLTAPLGAAGQAIDRVREADRNGAALRQELAELRAELSQLQGQQAQLEALKKENEQLREHLNLKQEHPTLALLDAKVVHRGDPTGRTVTLNKGTAHGVKVGMPVMTVGGLYGSVSQAGLTTCVVTTLHDEQVYIGATVARSGLNGTLCGIQPGEDRAILRYLDPSADIAKELVAGDIIVTSGYGETYPAGLAIGKVTGVEKVSYDGSYQAYVELFSDVVDTTYVMIVTGEEVPHE